LLLLLLLPRRVLLPAMGVTAMLVAGVWSRQHSQQ